MLALYNIKSTLDEVAACNGAMIHSVDGIQPRDLLWRLKCTRSMMTEGLLSKYVYKYNSEKKQLEQMYL